MCLYRGRVDTYYGAAMNIKAMQRQTVAELAQQQRQFSGSLKPQWFGRLLELAAAPSDPSPSATDVTGALSPVQCDIRFFLDGHKRPVVVGRAEAELALGCQRCELPVTRQLQVEFSITLVSEAQAAKARQEERAVDLRVVEQGRIQLIELLEDELLLAIPAQVCLEVDCANAPVMEFPARLEQAQTQAESAAAKADSPFAILEQLRTQPKDTK